MVSYDVAKQGIELEFQTVDKKLFTSKSANYRITNLQEIDNGYHIDDQKIEFSSKPFESLGDLEANLCKIISKGLEELHEEIKPILIGCPPFYQDFASGHIHTSVKNQDVTKTWLELRRRLYSAQPLMALLSQNSPITGSFRASDVRLSLSSWARFTEFESPSQDHWLALAYGQNGSTIEVRIPSAGPLPQILSIAALIRVLLNEDTDLLAVPYIKDNWESVISYGSSALTTVALPVGITYDGVKLKSVKTKATDLWRVFYEDNEDVFHKVLSSLSTSMRRSVEDFYQFIAAGHTLSDSIWEIFQTEEKKKFMDCLESMTYNSFDGEPLFKLIPTNPRRLMPIIDKFKTIDEFRDIVERMNRVPYTERMRTYNRDFFQAFTGPHGLLDNLEVRNLIRTIDEQEHIHREDLNAGFLETAKKLIDMKVLRISTFDGAFRAGENFGLIIQAGKESGIF